MPTKDTPWSFSRLNAYETCPRKYHQESVLKKYPFQSNAAADFGKYAHKAFENRFSHYTPLPMDLQHHEKYLTPLMQRPGNSIVEQQMALDANFEPTGWFDSDVWTRAIVDWAKFDSGVGQIVDWKFGKRPPQDSFDQVDLMVAVMMAYKPELMGVVGAFYWAKDKKFARKTCRREDVPEIWGGFLPRVERYEKAHRKIDFPPKPCFLCKAWCPVKTCEYNGV